MATLVHEMAPLVLGLTGVILAFAAMGRVAATPATAQALASMLLFIALAVAVGISAGWWHADPSSSSPSTSTSTHHRHADVDTPPPPPPSSTHTQLATLERVLATHHLVVVYVTHARCPYSFESGAAAVARTFEARAASNDSAARPPLDARPVFMRFEASDATAAALARTYSIDECPALVGFVNGEAHADTHFTAPRTYAAALAFVERLVATYAAVGDERTCTLSALLPPLETLPPPSPEP